VQPALDLIGGRIPSTAGDAVSQLPFCHSVQAKRDTESSNFINFWIPACAGMTTLKMFSPITTQSLEPGIPNRGIEVT